MKKYAINVTNIHQGGALQVVASFLEELYFSPINTGEVDLFASVAVAGSIMKGVDLPGKFNAVHVIDCKPLRLSNVRLWLALRRYERVLTVFGPAYFPGIPGCHIQGLGNEWVLSRDNEFYRTLKWSSKSRISIQYMLQKFCFKFADHIVTESERVGKRITFDRLLGKKAVSHINNAINRRYFEYHPRPTLQTVHERGHIVLGVMARDYPHKNLDFLVELKKELEVLMPLKVIMVVTLNDVEWRAKNEKFKSTIENVGAVNLECGVKFYAGLDGVVFPSLLETFSATPIEALAMQVPLFASDRVFVTDFCKNYGCYFDPNDTKNAAELIARYFSEKQDLQLKLASLCEARRYVLDTFSPVTRMEKYMDLLMGCSLESNAK